MIYSEASNTITFELRNSGGNVIDDTTLSVIIGWQRVNLNFDVPNDPDETEIIIQLVGNYDGGIVGIDAPGCSLPVVANGTGNFVLSEHIGKIVVIAFFAPG